MRGEGVSPQVSLWESRCGDCVLPLSPGEVATLVQYAACWLSLRLLLLSTIFRELLWGEWVRRGRGVGGSRCNSIPITLVGTTLQPFLFCR